MYLTRIDIKGRTTAGGFTLYPIGDLHHDQKGFDEDRFGNYREAILQDPNALCIFVGDAVEGHFPDHRHFDASIIRPGALANMDEYVRWCVEETEKLLSPIAKRKPLCIVEGNHDRFMKFTGFSAMVARGIGAHYMGGEGFVTVYSGKDGMKRRTVIYTAHGYGGGRKAGSSVNNMRDYMLSFKADIYVAGHTHVSHASIVPIIGANDAGTEVQQRNVALVRAPSFIRRSIKNVVTYAGHKGYGTHDQGLIAIEVDPQHGKMRRIEIAA